MKPSHLKTPRTMNEGMWVPGYQRGSFDDNPQAGYGALWWGCMVVILVLTVFLIGVTR